ncbi:hypothetical protein CRG98_036399 [Punica granatum]|uniref:PI-PLC X domain-containing protein At5g67130-like n=1 Tax=Punica granatum TaxID=22663 RepID=A0A2I0IGS0_PUNGR|nr:hypothetical protein CRG98_036399 [Punica granatum]
MGSLHLHLPQLLALLTVTLFFSASAACSNGGCKLLDECSANSDCEAGLYCFSCAGGFSGSRCVRSFYTDQFKLLNNSLPFNKYAYLTTHNAFAIDDGEPRLTFTNQEDNVTQQLNNGVRALMLDTYDFKGDVWLCHSFGGKCHDYTAFGPAIDTLKEIEAFLSTNPAEIVTLILEDYVQAPNGLTKVFTDAGLKKYWFPLTNMPKNGQDWPLVSDMVANNQRLLVFTSSESKEQNGDGGMKEGTCPNRGESSAMTDTSKSLILVNYFPSVPIKQISCENNSGDLINMLRTCYGAAGNRWANFVARSEGGGSFQAVDTLNGKLLCGCDDVHACVTCSA